MTQSTPTRLLARLADRDAFVRLTDRIRDIEPSLELFQPESDARLYDPDGTTYALQMGPPQTWLVHHRELRVEPGDLVVIPQSLAVDLDGPARLIALRHTGEPPDHFRERFIQVWGVDHLSSAGGAADGPRLDLIPQSAARYRLPYTLMHLDGTVPGRCERPPFWHATLVVALNGSVRVACPAGLEILDPGDLILLEHGDWIAFRGMGQCAVLSILPEVRHLERRSDLRRRGEAPSPEFRPGEGPTG